MGVTVRFVSVRADWITNLAGPRHLPEVFKAWRGRHSWHDVRYEPLRDEIERVYVDGFNRATQHYERLEVDLRTNGFRNPVMLSAGGLDRRDPREIPPGTERPVIACEYLGGSRVWVAQKHDMMVPAIVNDRANVFSDALTVTSTADLLQHFTDKPRTAKLGPSGAYVYNLPYMHIPRDERYTVSEQSHIRRKILVEVHRTVRDWLNEHD